MSHEEKDNVTYIHDEAPSTLVREEVNHTWDITNFSLRKTWFYSNQFGSHLDNSIQWRLAIHPGWPVFESKKSVRVRLDNEGSLNGSSFKFEVSILKRNGTEDFTRVDSWGRFTDGGKGRDIQLIDRGVLFDDANGLLHEDKLIIVSKISLDIFNEMESKRRITSHTKTSELALLNDIQKLHDTQIGSDVTLSTVDGDLRAHKAVLMARSPVFAAMFSTDMKEKNADRVTITDTPCAVLGEVLRFIYTGESPQKDKMSIDLYVAADKYNLKDLKDTCERFLLSTMSADSAGELLGLADMHNSQRMKSVVIRFIARQAPRVIQTEGWKAVIKAQPHLFSEVFQSMAEFISSVKTL